MSERYKSILDDEGALIGNAIKDSKNPFLTIKKNYLKRGNKFDEKDLKILDEKVFTGNYSRYKYNNYLRFLNNIQDLHDPEWVIAAFTWSFSIDNKSLTLLNGSFPIFQITFEGDNLYIYIEDHVNIQGWKKFKSHIIKKYNLTSSNMKNYYII